ncbi:MAG: YihY family inner membrane protein [Nitrospirales bacterium]|nr:YihY family inner membrane protein [Nitrospira sp.]MDR4501794.1 YihY family inner membrane protein [Nitrospirales bacterium]
MIQRAIGYCQRDLWEVNLDRLDPLKRYWVSCLRLMFVAAWEFKESVLSMRATSLVYTTLLSIVPFLAVMFSVLKAFGVHQEIEPLLAHALEPLGEKGADITHNIIGFVDNLKVGVLGAVGVAGLFYTTYSLIAKIEEALNSVWRVQQGRPLARQFTDYLSVVLVGPVFVFTAFGLTASAQSHWLVQQVVSIQPFGYLMLWATKLLPFVFICFVFTFLYKFVPYTSVKLSSAFVGGVTAGILWQLAGLIFAKTVASSGNYSAIYSSFAVLILFLIWLYVGWLIVLAGAQVAYYHQHPSAYLMQLRWRQNTHTFREHVTLAILLQMTRRYFGGSPPAEEWRIARKLNVPLSVVEEIINVLVEGGVVVKTSEPVGVSLGRPPEQVTVVEILDIVRAQDQAGPLFTHGEMKEVDKVLRKRDEAVEEALEGVTLRSLALNGHFPQDLTAPRLIHPEKTEPLPSSAVQD